MNPPYFKVAKDSVHAKIMASIVHGQPNIYAFFLALAAHWLRPGGELAAITPRSFCNGLYFRDFRKWFLRHMSLERLHLFESRTAAFQGADVLQENVITFSKRLNCQTPTIKISTSMGAEFSETLSCQRVPAGKVVSDRGQDWLIRIPTNARDMEVMELVDLLPFHFGDTGLRISTGPVVLFRAAAFLKQEPCGPDVAPLLLPHNIKPFETIWPLQKSSKPIAFQKSSASYRLLLPTKNYVLIKRFSAKEERRRLTAGCFLVAKQSYSFVALENHLNYIYHESRDLSENEVFGIAAILNSVLFDRYFRLLSGSTQVNATELRMMKFPSLDTLEVLGDRVRNKWPLDEDALEEVVINAITAATSVGQALAEIGA
jgi:adenine-specific DNA-methyltransferase